MTLLQRNFVTAKPINFYYLVCKLDRVQYPLFINITGSFLLGILTKNFASNSSLMLLFGIGLLGGYTTFSTFNVELISMMDERRWGMFAVYFGLSYLGGVIATICGMMI